MAVITGSRTTPPPRTRRGPALRARQRSRRRSERAVVNAVLLLLALCFLAPLLWLLLASVNGTAGLRITAPDPWTLGNFREVLTTDITFLPMLNGLILCGGATALCVVASVLAAYPLSRYESRFKRPFLLTILFATGLPITAVMVPVYGMFVQVNLIDTMYGTILFLGTSSLPFAIWLTKNFMDGVPLVLEEAAWTDGASGGAAADVARSDRRDDLHLHHDVGKLLRPVLPAALPRPTARVGQHLHLLRLTRNGAVRPARRLLHALLDARDHALCGDVPPDRRQFGARWSTQGLTKG